MSLQEVIDILYQITQKDIVLYPMNSVAEIAAVVSGKLR